MTGLEAPGLVLHGYFRSTASWRVRIAIGLKGLAFEQVAHHLRRGEQRDPAFLSLNPQGLVPALQIGGQTTLTQSLAIIEYLDETWPDPPLLPNDPVLRAKARAFSEAIACDIHPIQNLKVLDRLRALGLDEGQVEAWARTTIEDGLDACERLVTHGPDRFAFGGRPGLAEACLVPMLGNARRFKTELRWPRLLAIEAACAGLRAFADARPERQPDAE
jgi:maleylpyruvate isomerase